MKVDFIWCQAGYVQQGDTCVKCSHNCVDCEPGQLLKDYDCVASCGNYYYKSGNSCLHCHSSCKTCADKESNKCLSCKSSS